MENHATSIPQEKQCSICGGVKSLSVFENDRRRPDGHGPRCKDCIKSKRSKSNTPEAKAKKAKEIGKKIAKEGWQEGKREEKPKSRLQGKDPYKDKYGVDWSPTNMCDCGHYLHRHVPVKNPDGAGDILVCWVGEHGKRCGCRNYRHTPKAAEVTA